MKITCIGFGSDGDIRPLVALAVGLRDAGHEPVIVGDEDGAPLLAEHGLEFHALAGSVRGMLESGGDGVVESGRISVKGLWESRPPDLAWLKTMVIAAAGADAVVGLPVAMYHALSAADQVGAIPIAANLQPMLPTREFPPAGLGPVGVPKFLNRPLGQLVDRAGWAVFGWGINRARRQLGHGRIPRSVPHAPMLGAWSPTLVPPPSDWNHCLVTVTGQWHLAGAPEWHPTSELADFMNAGEPPIYVGFGSMTGSPRLTDARDTILDAFAGRRVLLSAGWAGLDKTGLPDNVRSVGFVPHDWLFPRCAAIVHHCGAGTTHAAARSGTPSIPVPLTLDQPFWAERLHRLGVASRPVDRKNHTPDSFTAALAEATTDQIQAKASTTAARFASEDGVSKAIVTIERIVDGQKK